LSSRWASLVKKSGHRDRFFSLAGSYSLPLSSRWASFSYRVAFLSACVTYGIVVYKAYRARMRTGKQGGILSLATDENVQYLSMFSSRLRSYIPRSGAS
jgi:hypothetical protein